MRSEVTRIRFRGVAGRAAFILLCLAPPAPLLAQSLAVEVFSANYGNDTRTTGLGLEYDAPPFARRGRADFSFGAGLTVDQKGNLWFGAGPVVHLPIGERWFTEASLMPGLYSDSGADYDLGSTLQFRTSIAVGYQLNDRTALSFAAHHTSNADIFPDNPGTNAFGLRLERDF